MQLGRMRNIRTGSAMKVGEMGINTAYSIQGDQMLETMAWLAIQLIASKLFLAMKVAQGFQVSTQVKTGAKITKFFAENLSEQDNKKPVPVQSSWIHSIAYMEVTKVSGSIVVFFKQTATNKKAPVISLPMYSPIDFSRFLRSKSKGQFYLDNIALKTPGRGSGLSLNFTRGFISPKMSALQKGKIQEYMQLEERANWAKTFLSMSPAERQRHRMIFDPQTGWTGKADTFMEKYGLPKNNREAMRSELKITEINDVAENSIREYEKWVATEATKKGALDRIAKFNKYKRKVTQTKRLASNPLMYAKAQGRRKAVGNRMEKGAEADKAKKKAISANKSLTTAQKKKARAKLAKSRQRKSFLTQATSKGAMSGNLKSGFKRQSRQSGRKRAIRTSNKRARKKG